MAVVSYNAGADQILERALGTTALDLRAAYLTATGGATDIAAIIEPDLATVAAIDALTGIGVSTERVAVTGEASTADNANNRANFDTNDVTFQAEAETAWGWIVYDEAGGSDATRIPIYGQSFTSGQPVNGGLTLTVVDLFRLLTATG